MAGGSDRWYPTDIYGARIEIDQPHSNIHAGKVFTASHTVSVGTGTAATVLLTPSDYAHTTFEILATNSGTWAFSEAPNASGGTAITSHNHNRTSTTTTPVAATHTATWVSSGTILQNGAIGTAGQGNVQGGGAGLARNEWILDSAKLYLLRFVALNAGTNVIINVSYYVNS